MDFTLDLLENSYDYISESLMYYKEYCYIETHDPDRDDVLLKRKWKTTFVLLTQAIELLVKEKLSRINPQLVFDNIDIKNNDSSKTITFSKAFDRLLYLDSTVLKNVDIDFIKKCINVRNSCIHYKIKMNSIEIKQKYCKLFEQYLVLHRNIIGSDYYNREYVYQIDDIKVKARDFVVYRGNEYRKKELAEYKNQFNNSQELCYAISHNQAFERVKYGEENTIYNILGYDINASNCRYCGDCLATYGEYHDLGCDCELCPKCGLQLISCECIEEYCNLEYIKDKNIKISNGILENNGKDDKKC